MSDLGDRKSEIVHREIQHQTAWERRHGGKRTQPKKRDASDTLGTDLVVALGDDAVVCGGHKTFYRVEHVRQFVIPAHSVHSESAHLQHIQSTLLNSVSHDCPSTDQPPLKF